MAPCRQMWCWTTYYPPFTVLLLDLLIAEGVCLTGHSLSIGALKATYKKAAPIPTRKYLLIEPLPIGQVFKHTSLWKPYFFKPPHPVNTASLCEFICVSVLLCLEFTVFLVSFIHTSTENLFHSFYPLFQNSLSTEGKGSMKTPHLGLSDLSSLIISLSPSLFSIHLGLYFFQFDAGGKCTGIAEHQ